MVEQNPKNATRKRLLLRGVITLVLLASLGALIAPNFTRYRCRVGPTTMCKSNLKNIGTALEMYSTDWSGHYPRNLNLLTPNYLKTLPVCPGAKRVTYRADFGPSAPGNEGHLEDYFYVECTGLNHEYLELPADYPKYTSEYGLIER